MKFYLSHDRNVHQTYEIPIMMALLNVKYELLSYIIVNPRDVRIMPVDFNLDFISIDRCAEKNSKTKLSTLLIITFQTLVSHKILLTLMCTL